MSAATRREAQNLRRKYARYFGVDIVSVSIVEFYNHLDQEDAEVSAPNLPKWTLGAKKP